MWLRGSCIIRRIKQFFYLSMNHTSLNSYYTLNFQLMKHCNWSLDEMDGLIPWEKDIYVIQLEEWIKEEEKRNNKK